MTEPLLQVRALRKSFGALAVTDDVSLSVTEGELHAIIGPNGAGKTTLISQLSGQLAPDSGTILYDGAPITRLDMAARVRRGLARSFQITALLPGMSVLENVSLAVQARSGSSYRFWRPVADDAALSQEAMQALDEVGLADRAHRPARALSHGEQRQLELAVALATKPRLLLLDEPLAGTGGQEAEVLISLMRRLKDRLTIVLIEHDMGAVFALADRVSVLVYGQIAASGTPGDIRADPKVRAAYLGEEEEGTPDA
ncbi:ABC transporter ATP-binding protein [Pseudooceanicola sediminis]|uniref:ABC transporter ATP-binding protein n=1 Tax=Pseudooceanicola sediminis TaxID=2211117 RepID=A0A399J5S4_9RHOB|nr:ABC transporter ATP-binding protein [Pseudooceanicola sediminis]KAA2314214.1 ABC transporter ATP-binding protein [Puniceibacterium sp. HSS470]RII39927.1 ABC transporter ATP-binding protein [Pseudooceanicola sediminis]|tara:strand:+ start:93483 stop:94250 length:768 start_codon:yes stop_codon:yes gene_type:complete